MLDNCYSSFYGDDSALAALNLSEIITSSAASVPAQRDICTSSMKEESNQFYGLPRQVKELLQKYKGIESLYGKNVGLAIYLVRELGSARPSSSPDISFVQTPSRKRARVVSD